MKQRPFILFLAVIFVTCTPGSRSGSLVDNPVVLGQYLADPSARVFGDTLYLFSSHDRNDATDFTMEDYYVYTTADMTEFVDHGVCFNPIQQTSWSSRYAWAPDCVERNGRFYLYFPTDQRHIGVAVADSPYGPFQDALGKPLISIDSPGVVCNRDFIDPCVFVDDDGQAYLFMGQNDVCCVKLNEDMVSYDRSGGRVDTNGNQTGVYLIEGVFEFFEAVWVHKYQGRYYLSYSNGSANGNLPEIAYAVAEHPLGPYTYKGVILPPVSSRTNHHSIVEYRGQWYIFYHTSDLSRYLHPELEWEYMYRRNVCVEPLRYAPDGSILPVALRPADVHRMAASPLKSQL